MRYITAQHVLGSMAQDNSASDDAAAMNLCVPQRTCLHGRAREPKRRGHP
jgi:hypothetical protein